MKHIAFIILILLSTNSFAQKSDGYLNLIKELKKETKADKSDKTVYDLLNNIYEEMLQSESGVLKPETIDKVQNFYSDSNSKNKHIFNMFFAYQNHITETTAVGKEPNSKFQVDLISDLEEEINNVYGDVPIIILIYKAEALNSNGQTKESADLISSSLAIFPASIPLKVYKYLDTKDEKIKLDLVKNHSNHWMVQQFKIK